MSIWGVDCSKHFEKLKILRILKFELKSVLSHNKTPNNLTSTHMTVYSLI